MPKPLVSIVVPTLGDRRELETWEAWGRFVMQSRDDLEKMLCEIAEREEKKRMEHEAMRSECETFEAGLTRGRWMGYWVGVICGVLGAFLIAAIIL
ncbi:hypothetical protein [Nitratidesulfovibrio sp. 1201_IL3209]|uniref:hypothetical protein n=1 Tax=Nitratidesulfovibrio sp. 1201_IL3209 TaxID=3084053 RepID=UPI002FDA78FF